MFSNPLSLKKVYFFQINFASFLFLLEHHRAAISQPFPYLVSASFPVPLSHVSRTQQNRICTTSTTPPALFYLCPFRNSPSQALSQSNSAPRGIFLSPAIVPDVVSHRNSSDIFIRIELGDYPVDIVIQNVGGVLNDEEILKVGLRGGAII